MTNVLEPIESKVALRTALKSNLNALQAKADELGKRLHLHNSFDAEKHTADISDLYSQKESTHNVLKDIRSSIDKYIPELNYYKSKAVSPLNIFNYFSTEQTAIRAHIEKLDQHYKKLQSNFSSTEK